MAANTVFHFDLLGDDECDDVEVLYERMAAKKAAEEEAARRQAEEEARLKQLAKNHKNQDIEVLYYYDTESGERVYENVNGEKVDIREEDAKERGKLHPISQNGWKRQAKGYRNQGPRYEYVQRRAPRARNQSHNASSQQINGVGNGCEVQHNQYNGVGGGKGRYSRGNRGKGRSPVYRVRKSSNISDENVVEAPQTECFVGAVQTDNVVDAAQIDANAEGDACVTIEASKDEDVEVKTAEEANVNTPDQEETPEESKQRRVKEKAEAKERRDRERRATEEEERRQRLAEERAKERNYKTLAQYEKEMLEKKKTLEAKVAEERKVTIDKDLEAMKLAGKKQDDEVILVAGKEKPQKKSTAKTEGRNDDKLKDTKAVAPVAEINVFFRPPPYRMHRDEGAFDRRNHSSDSTRRNVAKRNHNVARPGDHVLSLNEFPKLGEVSLKETADESASNSCNVTSASNSAPSASNYPEANQSARGGNRPRAPNRSISSGNRSSGNQFSRGGYRSADRSAQLGDHSSSNQFARSADILAPSGNRSYADQSVNVASRSHALKQQPPSRPFWKENNLPKKPEPSADNFPSAADSRPSATGGGKRSSTANRSAPSKGSSANQLETQFC